MPSPKKAPAKLPFKNHLPQQQRKALILFAATQVFSQYGYDGASLDKVAAAAGVSKALVVSYYGSKEQLAAAYIEQYTGRFMEAFAEHAQQNENLRNFLEDIFGFVRSTRNDMRFIVSMMGVPANEAFTKKIIGTHLQDMQQLFWKYVDQAPKGEMSVFMYMYFSMVASYTLGGDVQNFEQAKNALLEKFNIP